MYVAILSLSLSGLGGYYDQRTGSHLYPPIIDESLLYPFLLIMEAPPPSGKVANTCTAKLIHVLAWPHPFFSQYLWVCVCVCITSSSFPTSYSLDEFDAIFHTAITEFLDFEWAISTYQVNLCIVYRRDLKYVPPSWFSHERRGSSGFLRAVLWSLAACFGSRVIHIIWPDKFSTASQVI